MTDLPDKGRPLVTIVLLCYKQQGFVAEAVRGVLSQTYSPLEIIIFDDCSPDRTADVIKRTIAEGDNRHNVRFICNPENISGYKVTEVGLGMAKGAFIFISHGDDIMLPGMVDEIMQTLIREDLSLVTVNAHYIDENSNSLNRTYRDIGQQSDDRFETLARDGANACCFGPAIGFERAIYDTFGWIPPYLQAYDIMYPFYAYLLKGAKFINKPLLKYRVHGANTSLSLIAEKADAHGKAMVEERIYLGHMAHATLMLEEIDRLIAKAPGRYASLATRIVPLLNIQLAEMSKKLIRASRQYGTLAQAVRA